jgi:hypothetical protein
MIGGLRRINMWARLVTYDVFILKPSSLGISQVVHAEYSLIILSHIDSRGPINHKQSKTGYATNLQASM